MGGWKDAYDELHHRIYGYKNKKGLTEHVECVRKDVAAGEFQRVAYYYKEIRAKCREIDRGFEGLSKHEEVTKLKLEYAKIKSEVDGIFSRNMRSFEKYL